MKELDEKLAKWLSPNASTHLWNEYDTCSWCHRHKKWEWETPDCTHVPDFTSSIDACFKWLVPKSALTFGEDYYDFMRDWLDEAMCVDATDEDMVKEAARAFCQVLGAWIAEEGPARVVEQSIDSGSGERLIALTE